MANVHFVLGLVLGGNTAEAVISERLCLHED